MLIGEQLHSIIRTIQNQCTTDEQMDIISYFLSDSYKVVTSDRNNVVTLYKNLVKKMKFKFLWFEILYSTKYPRYRWGYDPDKLYTGNKYKTGYF
jgi:hypothetical protein